MLSVCTLRYQYSVSNAYHILSIIFAIAISIILYRQLYTHPNYIGYICHHPYVKARIMCTVPVVSITVRRLYLFPGTDGTALGTAISTIPWYSYYTHLLVYLLAIQEYRWD